MCEVSKQQHTQCLRKGLARLTKILSRKRLCLCHIIYCLCMSFAVFSRTSSLHTTWLKPLPRKSISLYTTSWCKTYGNTSICCNLGNLNLSFIIFFRREISLPDRESVRWGFKLEAYPNIGRDHMSVGNRACDNYRFFTCSPFILYLGLFWKCPCVNLHVFGNFWTYNKRPVLNFQTFRGFFWTYITSTSA